MMEIEKKMTTTETTTTGGVRPNEKVYKYDDNPYLYQVSFPTKLSELVDDVGLSFCLGLSGGAVYHFMKPSCLNKCLPLFTKQKQIPNQNLIVAGIRAARANSPRVAGMLALLAVIDDVLHIAGNHYRRRQGSYLGRLDSIAAQTLAGTLLFAPRGLVAASRAALGFGLFSSLCCVYGCNSVYGSFTVPNPNYNSLSYRYLARKQQEQRGGGPVPVVDDHDDDVRLFGVK